MREFADDKIQLAERGASLITRHLAKLERECEKVQRSGIQLGLQPLAQQMQELRTAAATPYSAPASPAPVYAGAATPTDSRGISTWARFSFLTYTERKNPSALAINTGVGSPAAPSPLSTSTNAYNAATSARAGRPSRLSSTFVAANSPAVSDADSYGTRERKRTYKKRKMEEDDYEDEDAEGEEEEEEEATANGSAAGNPNDDALYCLCQRVSFGEMVGCDNDACTYEWFHFECVGLTKRPEGAWFCPLCRDSAQPEPVNPRARGRK